MKSSTKINNKAWSMFLKWHYISHTPLLSETHYVEATSWGEASDNSTQYIKISNLPWAHYHWPTWPIYCLDWYAVLPSRSALSDLGLIADLFQKMLPNWSSFCLKSPFFGQKSPKSLIFTLSAFHIPQKNYLKNSNKYGIFLNKSGFA